MKKSFLCTLFFWCAFIFAQQEYKMPVANVISLQPAQAGNETYLCIDNNINTTYQSDWDQVGIPDKLDFYFSKRVKSIKKLIYKPRISGGYNGMWINVKVSYSTRNAPSTFVSAVNGDISFPLDMNAKTIELPNAIVNPAVIRIEILNGHNNYSSCAEMEFYSNDEILPVQSECILPISEFVQYQDKKIIPQINGSSASSFQNGYNIEKSFDGDESTNYESNWNSNSSALPVSLIYKFDGQTSLNYLKYSPRQGGGNGDFGNIKVSYNTLANANYTVVGTQNFAQQGEVSIMNFPSSITPLNIKIEVLDGKNGYATCGEMGFYQKSGISMDVPAQVGTKILPLINGSSASSFQTGYDIGKSFDGDTSTNYESSWGSNFSAFPVSVIYRFDGNTSIDYLKYIPRTGGGENGYFGNVKVSYNTLTNANYIVVGTQDFGQTETIKTMSFPSSIKPLNIKIEVLDGKNGYATCAEMEFYKNPTNAPAQIGTKISPQINGSSASSSQLGYGIERSFDGNTSTNYESNWSSASSAFPVSLIYKFDGNTPIDYLKYIPREVGGENGYFGNIKVSYNTLVNANYTVIGTRNFEQTGAVKTMNFPFSITPLNIKIEVLDGKNGYATCGEMEFYQNKTIFNAGAYPSIFNDDLFGELKNGVTQQAINAINSPFIKGLAQCLFNNSYNKKYRIKEYKPYKTLESIVDQYKISNYSAFENPTGILFEANTTAIIFAKNISSSDVKLRIRNFANENSPEDKMYILKNGLNIINIANRGLGYISYYTDNTSATPITLNITTGIVNGIFKTRETTADEWQDILTNDIYPKVDIEGYYTHLLIDKASVKKFHFLTAQPLIDKYDMITKSQREVMGFFKFNKNFKNRQFVYTEYKGGWFAGGLGAHFDLTWGEAAITSEAGLGIWGVAHELGHTNQIRPGLRWIGLSEVTNNIYSAWADYNIQSTVNHRFTRMEEEAAVGYNTAFPAVAGNRYGEFIKQTLVNKKNYADGFIVGSPNSSDNNFRVLVPFWQLELYYQLAGASKNAPTLTFDNDMSDEDVIISTPVATGTVDYAHWFANVANKVLSTNDPQLTQGQLAMNFVKNTCDAVQEDLTDFFTKTGFLRPIDESIGDYSNGKLTITQSMIDEVKNYVAAKGYLKPVSPVVNYITAHSINIYKNKLPLSGITGVGVQLTNNTQGQFLLVDNSKWANAVAFETYNSNSELMSVSVLGTGDTSLSKTYVDFPSSATKVYAIGYDGQKILVYPSSSQVAKYATSKSEIHSETLNEVNDFKIYPNPLKKGQDLKINIKNVKGDYTVKLYDGSGKLLIQSKGSLEIVTQALNNQLSKSISGVYLISISNEVHHYETKIIKE